MYLSNESILIKKFIIYIYSSLLSLEKCLDLKFVKYINSSPSAWAFACTDFLKWSYKQVLNMAGAHGFWHGFLKSMGYIWQRLTGFGTDSLNLCAKYRRDSRVLARLSWFSVLNLADYYYLTRLSSGFWEYVWANLKNLVKIPCHSGTIII